MADTKISALGAAAAGAEADQTVWIQGGASKAITGAVLRTFATGSATGFSTATVSAGYAVDTYLAGSGGTLANAGSWKAGTQYRLRFDMTKTAAGTATPILVLRLGTTGTTRDAAILTFIFSA